MAMCTRYISVPRDDAPHTRASVLSPRRGTTPPPPPSSTYRGTTGHRPGLQKAQNLQAQNQCPTAMH